jgi:hypothetical protein
MRLVGGLVGIVVVVVEAMEEGMVVGVVRRREGRRMKSYKVRINGRGLEMGEDSFSFISMARLFGGGFGFWLWLMGVWVLVSWGLLVGLFMSVILSCFLLLSSFWL